MPFAIQAKLSFWHLSSCRLFTFSLLILLTMIIAHHMTHFFFARFKTTTYHHAHAKCTYTSHHSFALSFYKKRYINTIYSCFTLERIFELYVLYENFCERE